MNPTANAPTSAARSRLDSWKMIGAFFNCNERTVKRWEKERGLPIRRLPGASRSRIYAEVAELEAWLRNGVVGTQASAPPPIARTYEVRRASFSYRPLSWGALLQ